MSWNRKMLRKLAKGGLTVVKDEGGKNVYASYRPPKPEPYKSVLPPRAERQPNAPKPFERMRWFTRFKRAVAHFFRRIFAKKSVA